jgi:hypothetical protein
MDSFEIVKNRFLQSGEIEAENVNITDGIGNTLLMRLCDNPDHIYAAKKLIYKGADVSVIVNNTCALKNAISCGIPYFLLEELLFLSNNDCIMTYLNNMRTQRGQILGNPEICYRLIDILEEREPGYITSNRDFLSLIIRSSNYYVWLYIISKCPNAGDNINIDDINYSLDTGYANSRMIIMLLRNCESFHWIDIKGIVTCFNDRETIRIVCLLISMGYDINMRDDIGETILHKYARYRSPASNAAVFSKLVKMGADIRIIDNRGCSIWCPKYPNQSRYFGILDSIKLKHVPPICESHTNCRLRWTLYKCIMKGKLSKKKIKSMCGYHGYETVYRYVRHVDLLVRQDKYLPIFRSICHKEDSSVIRFIRHQLYERLLWKIIDSYAYSPTDVSYVTKNILENTGIDMIHLCDSPDCLL